MTVDLSNVQSPTIDVYDAASACVSVELLDRLLLGARYKTGLPTAEFLRSIRHRSHSIQIHLFEAVGIKFAESEGKRIAPNGVTWLSDDTLPLDCILLERIKGGVTLGRIEHLYPTCPVCLEYRVEEALRAQGLLRAQQGRTLIEVKGEPVSETIIRERG